MLPFDIDGADELREKEEIEPTPIVLSKSISQQLDIELFVKDETVLPTGTFKDREGFISLYRLWKNDVQNMALFSSGNTGSSLARSAGLFGGPVLHLIVPESSRKRVENGKMRCFFDHDHVRIYYWNGSNDECEDYARQLAQTNGYRFEGGFQNYARREGLKLFGLEYIFDWDRVVDWYVQPVAGGIGIYSFNKAHMDTGRACPRMLAVQAEICAPMVNAWKEGSDILEARHIPDHITPSKFVKVLRTRRPLVSYPIIKRIMDEVGGVFEAVSEKEIYEGLRLFYCEDYFKRRFAEGMTVGLEPATALAGISKAVRKGIILPGEKVLLNVSGMAKEGDVKPEWISDLV